MTEVNENIWVLGSNGFIGKSLVKVLSNDSRYLLHLLIHKNYNLKEVESYNSFIANLSTISKDLFLNYPPKVIFHAARSGGRNNLWRYLKVYHGLKANQRLVNMIEELKPPPIVVYVSGSLMYGQISQGKQAIEGDSLNPYSYARVYQYAEKPWIDAQKSKILDVRFARPGWIVGPSSWFYEFFWLPYKKNGKVPYYGNGDQLMSVVHYMDCANLIRSLYEFGSEFQDLNISPCEPVTQYDFSSSLAELLGVELEQVSFSKLKWEIGKVAAKALTSSIPMQTKYPDIHAKANIKFTKVKDILADVVTILEHKK